jgi:hypothetical protein
MGINICRGIGQRRLRVVQQIVVVGVVALRGHELGRVGYLKPNDFALMLRFVQEKSL